LAGVSAERQSEFDFPVTGLEHEVRGVRSLNNLRRDVWKNQLRFIK